ncbi:hypothetical protein C1D09_018700 [Mesorhizobium intechi]|uniref:hypothetical protein n=1 Tax=Mesorhizobium intechi TaxID=537601 RepID=UPI000CAA68CB|nr:hypothetical protein [Mesorhizobium intechi]TSE07562.1 hypothetical protein C1D09_018700 [Mesorhizobium intechi]
MTSFSDLPAAWFKGRFSRRAVLIRAVVAAPAVGAAAVAASMESPIGEVPVQKVNRLARELAYAMDEWMADISHSECPLALWAAHVWPASSGRGIYFKNEGV